MLCRKPKRTVLLCTMMVLSILCFLKLRTSSKPEKVLFSKEVAFSELDANDGKDLKSPLFSASNAPADFDSFSLRDQVDFEDRNGGSWRQGWDVIVKDRKSKLRVRIIPHSHLDTSWVKTFNEYYTNQVVHILDNVIQLLRDNEEFRFQWDAIAFLDRWWNETTEQNRNSFKEFVSKGRFDTGAGGWVVPDEALSHFVSIIDQLSYGHEWLTNKSLCDVARRRSAWSIDLFGYSSANVRILKEAGIERLSIHRLHYAVKRHLAKRAGMLEFIWDDSVLVHADPFYSYDIPHTCGPNPEICCQFDFERLLLGMSCPWNAGQPVLPNRINMHSRAVTLLEQFRKKAELYDPTNRIVLVELGDDFRYANYGAAKSAIENYKRLMDYMNDMEEWNVDVRFSTLSEYFDEIESYKHVRFSGDFFPYSDRAQNYWSGYYSTRPYLKTSGTQLLAKMRSSSILNAYSNVDHRSKSIISDIRKIHAFYTHHDTVTGTSKQYVIDENERDLREMDRLCRNVHYE